MDRKRRGHDLLVFFTFKGASCIQQLAARFEMLESLGQDQDLAGLKALQVAGRETPFDLGIPRQRASAGTRRIDEDALETASEGERFGGIHNHSRANWRNIPDAPKADVACDREAGARFERLKRFVAGRGAQVQIGLPGPEIQQWNDRLRADVVEPRGDDCSVEHAIAPGYVRDLQPCSGGWFRSAFRDPDVAVGFLQSGACNRKRLVTAEKAHPAVEHPLRAGNFGREIGPIHRVTGHLSQDGIDQARSRALFAFDEFDGVVDGGVGRNALEIAELKNSRAEGEQDGDVQSCRLAAGVEQDQVIQLRLVPQTTVNERGGETGIAGCEIVAAVEQGIGCIGALGDCGQNIQGGAASRRNQRIKAPVTSISKMY
jgi:hypothetical protein